MDEYKTKIQETVRELMGNYIGEKLKISYEECANRINQHCKDDGTDYRITAQAIHQYIGGGQNKRKIPIEFVAAFAESFDLSFDYLFGTLGVTGRDNNIIAAAEAIGTDDAKTIEALKAIFDVWQGAVAVIGDFGYIPSENMLNILNQIIQGEELHKLFYEYYIYASERIKLNCELNLDDIDIINTVCINVMTGLAEPRHHIYGVLSSPVDVCKFYISESAVGVTRNESINAAIDNLANVLIPPEVPSRDEVDFAFKNFSIEDATPNQNTPNTQPRKKTAPTSKGKTK